MTQPAWLQEAAALPVAFAQVREDPLIDEALAARAGNGARICMIASGGCTAAALAALPGIGLIHCVDPNSAQLALAQIKLSLLRYASTAERLIALGHGECSRALRGVAIARAREQAGQQDTDLGPQDLLDTLGLDHIGRYERLFAALRVRLEPVAAGIAKLLLLDDLTGQRNCIRADGPLWPVIESAFLEVMALPNLVTLFGEGATRNPREAFPQHFLRRLRWAIEHLPARTNPFLAQLLGGQFAPNQTHRWIALPSPTSMPEMEWEQAFMVPALRRQPRCFDIVHLSNILDWLSPAEAGETLAAACAALRRGGYVIVRQLNSSLDILALDTGLIWDSALGSHFLNRDRSFFYRNILVGRSR